MNSKVVTVTVSLCHPTAGQRPLPITSKSKAVLTKHNIITTTSLFCRDFRLGDVLYTQLQKYRKTKLYFLHQVFSLYEILIVLIFYSCSGNSRSGRYDIGKTTVYKYETIVVTPVSNWTMVLFIIIIIQPVVSHCWAKASLNSFHFSRLSAAVFQFFTKRSNSSRHLRLGLPRRRVLCFGIQSDICFVQRLCDIRHARPAQSSSHFSLAAFSPTSSICVKERSIVFLIRSESLTPKILRSIRLWQTVRVVFWCLVKDHVWTPFFLGPAGKIVGITNPAHGENVSGRQCQTSTD